MKFGGYKNLIVWQKSIALDEYLNELITKFPKHETYGLMGQIARASASITANIAEGHERNGTKEFVNFIGIARGSLGELDSLLILAHNRKYFDKNKHEEISQKIIEIAKMLWSLRQKLIEKLK